MGVFYFKQYLYNMKRIFEGFTEEGTPDLKYYAFDWDDNIMYMPTKIILKEKNGKEVGMGTHDFAKYRTLIGKEEFEYNGNTIVGFSDDPFRYFGEKGDEEFLIGSLMAKKGPAWSDFVEAINGGSIFSIITARGHHPNTLKKGVKQLIDGEIDGISKQEIVKNLKKYRDKVKGLPTEKLDDKLSDHIWDPKVIVVYSSSGCGMCTILKPKLYHVNEEQNACESIARILRYGSKAEVPAEGTEAATPPVEEPAAEPEV